MLVNPLRMCEGYGTLFVCVCVCYKVTSYAICLNVQSNIPMESKRCFLDFSLVNFAKNFLDTAV